MMIHRLRVLIVVVLLAAFVLPSMALASSSATVVKLWVGNNIMTIGGVRQPIDSEGTKPVIVEGRTLVPIRAVIEAFDGSVAWDATERRVTVTLDENALDLWIGKSTASLNGTTLPVDRENPRVIPVIMSGRTMLPLRFVSESLGIDVQYEASAKMITLTYMVNMAGVNLSAPVLLAPADATSLSTLTPTLTWQEVSSATSYDVCVDKGSNESRVYEVAVTGTSCTIPAGVLESSVTYRWSVIAGTSDGWSKKGGIWNWSLSRTFTVQAMTLSAPRLLTPLGDSILDSTSIVLTWESVASADSYRIQILRDGTEVHAASGLSSTAYTVPSGVLSSGSYSWQVATHGSGGWSGWSDAFFFEARAKLTVSDIAKYVDRMVLIEVNGFEDGKAFSASGSGFFISSDGKIVTNYHVIDAATQGTVTLNGGQKYDIASVLGYNKDQDLAVIRISGTGFPTCTLGDSSKVAVGDPVVAIGSPLGIQNTVSEGIVSKIWDDGDLQITAPISPGSSGGALFNMYGEVIGVTAWKIRNGENLNGAIPVNLLHSLDTTLNPTLAQVFQKEYPTATVLSAPVLVSPAPDATLSTLTPTLSWTAVPGATKYEVRIWIAPTSATNLVDQVVTGTSYPIPSGTLSFGIRYGWTVFAGNSLGWSDQMTIGTPPATYSPAFMVQAATKLAAPVLAGPDEASGFWTFQGPIQFKWLPVTGADHYELWIGLGIDGGESTAVYKQSVYGTIYSLPQSTLSRSQVYTWSVRADNYASDSNSSSWSLSRHFAVTADDQLGLLSPSNYATVYFSPTLSWLPYSGATTYSVQVYRGATFSASSVNVVSAHVSGTSYAIPALTLTKGEAYCWIIYAWRYEYINGKLEIFTIATSDLYVLYASP